MIVRVVAVLHHGVCITAPEADGIVGHTVLVQTRVGIAVVGESIGKIGIAVCKEAAGHVIVAEHPVGLKSEVDLLVEIIVAGSKGDGTTERKSCDC